MEQYTLSELAEAVDLFIRDYELKELARKSRENRPSCCGKHMQRWFNGTTSYKGKAYFCESCRKFQFFPEEDTNKE